MNRTKISHSASPIIMFTLGDPAGVGPEIVARYLKSLHETDLLTVSDDIGVSAATRVPQMTTVVVGDFSVFAMACEQFGISWGEDHLGIDCLKKSDVPLLFDGFFSRDDAIFANQVTTLRSTLSAARGGVSFIDIENLVAENLRKGHVQTEAGLSAGKAIEVSINAARCGAVDAVVTAPIHKVSFREAGYTIYPGHTEMYGEQLAKGAYCMMLVCGGFSVCHVSLHTSLRDAIERDIKRDRILDVIRLAHEHGLRQGTAPQCHAPKIGVCALNPHGGEGGLFGREELDEIIPAVTAAKAEGIDVIGPLPSDTVFIKAKAGRFDYVIAMYHDQGHIAAKMEGFSVDAQGTWTVEGINVTLGLPIIRTSVDHGTAFDIAWKGLASTKSLHDATQYALGMLTHR